MLPAHQRLEAAEGAGGEVDLRLEEGDELAALEAGSSSAKSASRRSASARRLSRK